MSDIDHSLEIGKLQEQVAAVRRDNDRMAASLERIEIDVRDMASTIHEARGGWKVLVAAASISGVIGAGLSTWWHSIGGGLK